MVFSFQEQRVVSLLVWIRERGLERNKFQQLEQNDHGKKRPETLPSNRNTTIQMNIN